MGVEAGEYLESDRSEALLHLLSVHLVRPARGKEGTPLQSARSLGGSTNGGLRGTHMSARPVTATSPLVMSPAMSPYFARPATSRMPTALSFSVGGKTTSRPGSSSTLSRGKARVSTATAGGGRVKREWAQPTARDDVPLFDPNLGRFDQQYQSWREDNHANATKAEDREAQRIKRSMFGKKGA
ncbi:hypothetical protein T484DRAFT_1862181, partial [Baffinella frigidus]